MTWALFVAAAATTTADALAFLALVVPGHAREVNPIVARMDAGWAIAARMLVVLLCACIALIATRAGSRALTVVVRIALAIALVGGLLGAAATIAWMP